MSKHKQQKLEQQLKPRKRAADKARKAYDERLTMLNQHVRDLMKTKLGEGTPICPTCQSRDAKSMTPRQGLLVGIKACYKCKTCGRTYVADDDRFRNVWLKYRAVCMVTFGGPNMAQSAIKMLHDYGINADYSDIMRWLRSFGKS